MVMKTAPGMTRSFLAPNRFYPKNARLSLRCCNNKSDISGKLLWRQPCRLQQTSSSQAARLPLQSSSGWKSDIISVRGCFSATLPVSRDYFARRLEVLHRDTRESLRGKYFSSQISKQVSR